MTAFCGQRQRCQGVVASNVGPSLKETVKQRSLDLIRVTGAAEQQGYIAVWRSAAG